MHVISNILLNQSKKQQISIQTSIQNFFSPDLKQEKKTIRSTKLFSNFLFRIGCLLKPLARFKNIVSIVKFYVFK